MVRTGITAVEPVARQRRAAFSRAMQGEALLALAHDFDLPAGDGSVAQDADPFIIERMPFPARISGPQDREFFFGHEM